MEIIVKAWLNGGLVTAGKLRWSGRRVEFWYQGAFLERGYALDPLALPLTETVYESSQGLQGVLGVFGDALPDAWNIHVLQRRFGRQLSEAEMLLADRSPQRMGALQFFSAAGETEGEGTHTPEWLERLAAWVTAATPAPPPPEIEWGSSAGGAKPKTLISLDGAEWIAKLPAPSDVVPTPWIEHGTMRLAAACGIRVPETRLLILGDARKTPVLLVKRFDREGTARLHRLSAHSLCGVIQDERGAIINDHRSYLRFADRLAMICPGDPQDRHALFRRAAFNLLAGNHDDHAKNHAVVRGSDGQWRLSPAFDLVAGEGGRRDMAMIMGDKGNQASIPNLLSACGRFALTEREASAILGELLTLLANWRRLFADSGVPEQGIEAVAWAIKDQGDV